ncbi:MAG: PQQ-dependent sugar dehydrogenase [Bacteroidota bacterium]|nr:PQQ-dependent sugar dehydrogenase [Bacteroidota bacterium]
MKKVIFTIFQVITIVITCQAQFILQPAFPNMPDFAYPVELVTAYDGTNRLFLVQQKGKIYVFNNSPNVSTKKIFIDLTNKVSQTTVTGLFGLAFHPNYESNRYFYVHYVFDSAGSISGSWLRISRFTASLTNHDTALANTETFLLKVPLPGIYHNGGKVAFGPDGYLYISFGDGFIGAGAPAQDKTSLLGKILRINIDSSSGGNNYSIPPTNPFYGNTQGFKQEIYAYGLRNMWKFSFDVPTNRLFGADVGESSYEEIDLIESGKNYGWNKMEGFHCYGPCDTTGMGFTRPIFEYSHAIGYSVIGGYVYRGNLLPDLYGKYIYADEIFAKVWSLAYDGINSPVNTLLQDTTFEIVSLGVDESQELYVCTYSPTAGKIYKLVNKTALTLSLKAAIEGFYSVPNDRLNIRDTLKVYLNSSIPPYVIVDSSKTVIDSLSYNGLCFFRNAPTGKYYIVVKHRNALETWSRTGGDSLKKGGLLSYDFTSDSSKAYGNNQIRKGSKYVIFSGDVDHNGIIDLSDLSFIDNDAFNFIVGYFNTDLTGDNFVDLEDYTIADNNAFNIVTVERP